MAVPPFSSVRKLGASMPNGLRAALVVLAAGWLGSVFACSSDDSSDSIIRRSAATSSGDGGADPNDPNQLPPEEAKYRAVEPDLLKMCGRTCHDTGTFALPAPRFLAGPDTYKSIKSHPNIVVRDVYTSALLTKGTHEGPDLKQDPVIEKKVTDWLEAEAIAIKSQKLPSTPPFTVVAGPNDLDLTPACIGGLTGVHLKFDAAIVGTSLELTKITLVAPSGSDVHVLQPRFVRVLAAPDKDGTAEIPDPADSFSNADQTIAGGTEAALLPGSALFANASWRPFDLASDKLRIEMTKLEPGKVSVLAPAATCKDVKGFTDKVLPTIRQQQASNGKCVDCHGAGLAGMNLASDDTSLVCQEILQKLDQADITKSIIVTKVSGGMAHNGGTVADPNAWRQLFVANAGVFF